MGSNSDEEIQTNDTGTASDQRGAKSRSEGRWGVNGGASDRLLTTSVAFCLSSDDFETKPENK